jgi:hypothetical protein
MIRVLQNRYGLSKRENAVRENRADEKREAEQVGFAW